MDKRLGTALLLLLIGCAHTSPFTDAKGQVIPGSIATMEAITIGGISQSIWFRGIATQNPAIILLHGGPGTSESALFRHYDAALEQHFLMVYWEQRGAGRSYHGNIPPDSMTIGQFERDLDELVDLVRQRFGKHKVILLAHSWGTVLGTLCAYAHPDKVAAYIGIGQIANFAEYDWHIPSVLAARYFQIIDAPCKRLIWFEQSAHNPPFEEPEKFVRVMLDQVLPLITGKSKCCSASATQSRSGRPAPVNLLTKVLVTRQCEPPRELAWFS